MMKMPSFVYDSPKLCWLRKWKRDASDRSISRCTSLCANLSPSLSPVVITQSTVASCPRATRILVAISPRVCAGAPFILTRGCDSPETTTCTGLGGVMRVPATRRGRGYSGPHEEGTQCGRDRPAHFWPPTQCQRRVSGQSWTPSYKISTSNIPTLIRRTRGCSYPQGSAAQRRSFIHTRSSGPFDPKEACDSM